MYTNLMRRNYFFQTLGQKSSWKEQKRYSLLEVYHVGSNVIKAYAVEMVDTGLKPTSAVY